MKSRKERNSNYELMRIVSMFFVVLWHFLFHSQVVANTTGILNILLNLLMMFLVVHVSSFIVVTGFYQSDKRLRVGKVLKLIGQTWALRIIIAVVLVLFGQIHLDRLDIFKLMLPLGIDGEYWFINVYLVLYCLSPFLNKLVSCFDKKQFRKLLIVMFVVFSVLPTLTLQRTMFNRNGYLITTFVFLYLTGAYLRKHPIDKNYILKLWTPKMRQIVFFCAFIGFALLNFLLWNFSNTLVGYGSISTEISNTISSATLSYDNPLVYLQVIAYFLWFGTLTFKSKFINWVSALTFGIYIVQENNFLRTLLYEGVRKLLKSSCSGYSIIPKVIGVAIICFIGCLLVEFIRSSIAKFLAKRKIIIRVKEKLKKWVDSLGLQVNW